PPVQFGVVGAALARQNAPLGLLQVPPPVGQRSAAPKSIAAFGRSSRSTILRSAFCQYSLDAARLMMPTSGVMMFCTPCLILRFQVGSAASVTGPVPVPQAKVFGSRSPPNGETLSSRASMVVVPVHFHVASYL